MPLLTLCEWIQSTSLSLGIREGSWAFPLLNFGHVLGNSLMFGTIAFLDLRLLGAGLQRRRVSDVAEQLLPWTWTGWAIMFVTGGLIFWSEPLRCYTNIFFRIKMLLMVLAGLNALIFHLTIYRKVRDWDLALKIPRSARLGGAISLTLWICIVIAGRAIGYTAH